MQVFMRNRFQLGKWLGVHLLNCKVRPCFTFLRNCLPSCFPKWRYHSHQQERRGSHCSVSSSAVGVFVLFWFGFGLSHPYRSTVISHYFNLISLMTGNVKHLLICLFPICASSLGRYMFRSLAYFKNWVICVLILE